MSARVSGVTLTSDFRGTDVSVKVERQSRWLQQNDCNGDDIPQDLLDALQEWVNALAKKRSTNTLKEI